MPFGVTALNPAGVSRFIQVTGKAELVRLGGAKLRRVAGVFCRCRFGVPAAGAVTRLAGLPQSAELFCSFDHMMRCLRKSCEDVLMTGLADFRSDVLRRGCGLCRLLRIDQQCQPAECDGLERPSA
jgi:hypothetical protein